MITTSSTVTVTKVLRLGVITLYNVNNVSLFISHNGVQKRIDASAVVNSTLTSQGLITFSNVPLWEDGNFSLYVTSESSTDLNVSNTSLFKLGSGYIKKITNVATLAI